MNLKQDERLVVSSYSCLEEQFGLEWLLVQWLGCLRLLMCEGGVFHRLEGGVFPLYQHCCTEKMHQLAVWVAAMHPVSYPASGVVPMPLLKQKVDINLTADTFHIHHDAQDSDDPSDMVYIAMSRYVWVLDIAAVVSCSVAAVHLRYFLTW